MQFKQGSGSCCLIEAAFRDARQITERPVGDSWIRKRPVPSDGRTGAAAIHDGITCCHMEDLIYRNGRHAMVCKNDDPR